MTYVLACIEGDKLRFNQNEAQTYSELDKSFQYKACIQQIDYDLDCSEECPNDSVLLPEEIAYLKKCSVGKILGDLKCGHMFHDLITSDQCRRFYLNEIRLQVKQ